MLGRPLPATREACRLHPQAESPRPGGLQRAVSLRASSPPSIPSFFPCRRPQGGSGHSPNFPRDPSPTHVLTMALFSSEQPDCHLHLHLRWADNPYVSGTVHTKDSAPGLIMGAGRRWQEHPHLTESPLKGKTWWPWSWGQGVSTGSSGTASPGS